MGPSCCDGDDGDDGNDGDDGCAEDIACKFCSACYFGGTQCLIQTKTNKNKRRNVLPHQGAYSRANRSIPS